MWAAGLLAAILATSAGCVLRNPTSYSGRAFPSDNAALLGFVAEARLAEQDRAELGQRFGALMGARVNWVSADPQWVALERAQRSGELQRLQDRFQSSDLSPGKQLDYQRLLVRLEHELEALDCLGYSLLWPTEENGEQLDWLWGSNDLGQTRPKRPLDDQDSIDDWMAGLEKLGERCIRLTAELEARTAVGILPARAGVLTAQRRVDAALNSDLPQELAHFSACLTASDSWNDIERAQWRARAGQALQGFVGTPLQDLHTRLEELVPNCPRGNLSGTPKDRLAYRHLLGKSVGQPLTPEYLHRAHKETLVRIQADLRRLDPQASPSQDWGRWLSAHPNPCGEHTWPPESTSPRDPFPAWSDGWALYGSAHHGLESPQAPRASQHPAARDNLTLRLLVYALSVTDTGIHQEGWRHDHALAFLHEATGLSLDRAEQALGRIYLNPGRAVAGPVGVESFEDLLSRCRRRWGPDYDPSGLHDLIESTGPAPLDALGLRVLAWMRAQ